MNGRGERELLVALGARFTHALFGAARMLLVFGPMTVRTTVFGGALLELLHLVVGEEVRGVTEYIVGKQVAIAELVVALTQRAFKLVHIRIRKVRHTQTTSKYVTKRRNWIWIN